MKITEERILQIVNNVAEEYVDLGQVNFATKEEFCETILYLRKESQSNWDKYLALRTELLLLACH